MIKVDTTTSKNETQGEGGGGVLRKKFVLLYFLYQNACSLHRSLVTIIMVLIYSILVWRLLQWQIDANTIRSQTILTNSLSFMIAAISESLFPSILRSLMFAAKEQKVGHVGIQRFLFCVDWNRLHATFLKTNKKSEQVCKSQNSQMTDSSSDCRPYNAQGTGAQNGGVVQL